MLIGELVFGRLSTIGVVGISDDQNIPAASNDQDVPVASNDQRVPAISNDRDVPITGNDYQDTVSRESSDNQEHRYPRRSHRPPHDLNAIC